MSNIIISCVSGVVWESFSWVIMSVGLHVRSYSVLCRVVLLLGTLHGTLHGDGRFEVSIILRDTRGLVSYAIMLFTLRPVVVVLGGTNYGLGL